MPHNISTYTDCEIYAAIGVAKREVNKLQQEIRELEEEIVRRDIDRRRAQQKPNGD